MTHDTRARWLRVQLRHSLGLTRLLLGLSAFFYLSPVLACTSRPWERDSTVQATRYAARLATPAPTRPAGRGQPTLTPEGPCVALHRPEWYSCPAIRCRPEGGNER